MTPQITATSRTQVNGKFIPAILFMCGLAGVGLVILSVHAMVTSAVAGNWPTTDGEEAVVDLSRNGMNTLLLGIAIIAAYAGYVWYSRKRTAKR